MTSKEGEINKTIWTSSDDNEFEGRSATGAEPLSLVPGSFLLRWAGGRAW